MPRKTYAFFDGLCEGATNGYGRPLTPNGVQAHIEALVYDQAKYWREPPSAILDGTLAELQTRARHALKQVKAQEKAQKEAQNGSRF